MRVACRLFATDRMSARVHLPTPHVNLFCHPSRQVCIIHYSVLLSKSSTTFLKDYCYLNGKGLLVKFAYLIQFVHKRICRHCTRRGRSARGRTPLPTHPPGCWTDQTLDQTVDTNHTLLEQDNSNITTLNTKHFCKSFVLTYFIIHQLFHRT